MSQTDDSTAPATGQSTYTLDADLALEALDVLRMTPFFTLLGSEFQDELGDDFKPHKFEGFEREHAEQAVAVFRRMLKTMSEQAGIDYPETAE